VECWNIGQEKWKTDYPTRNVESTLFDDATSHIISFFPLQNTPLKYENQCRICALRLVSLNPSFDVGRSSFKPIPYGIIAT
jgi:hypothetical protein